MVDEIIIEQQKELKEALEVVNKWQDREDGDKLFSKVTNEFIAIKTNQYERWITKLFKEEANE